MRELQRLQRGAQAIHAAALILVGGAAVAVGHGDLLSGLAAGGLLGLLNLRWLVGTARRLSGASVSVRRLQAAGLLRLALLGTLLGVLLTWGHVHPIGAVIGYGLFPLSAAAAGYYALRARPRVAA